MKLTPKLLLSQARRRILYKKKTVQHSSAPAVHLRRMYVQVAKNGNAKKTQPETGCQHQLATHATKRKKKQKEAKKAKIHQSKQKLKTSQRRPPLKPPLKCCTQRNKPD